ncbi:MAG: UDP-3-O-(3-hydroxymyristoyl)glucosamine N-acyltransferase, partial [Candidatus Acidiferrales bacterium]
AETEERTAQQFVFISKLGFREAYMTRTAAELAQYLHAQIEGDRRAPITSLASPENAGPDSLIYVESEKHRARAQASRAACILTPPDMELTGKTVIRVASPKLAFAKAAAWLFPRKTVHANVHPTAIVSPRARISAEVSIGANVVIEDDVSIASGTEIGAFCFIGQGSSIGENCHLYPRVSLYAGVRIGRGVVIHSGAVIGADGFGYVFGEGRYWKFPQIGRVEIGDDVEIGANTTVDRGALDATRIANGAKIDNLVQIAHNVQIGENTVIAAQTGISGSTVVGSGVVIGGQVGIADHCTIEDSAIVGAQAGIPTGKRIRSGQIVWGTPARPLERFKEQYAWLSRLPEIGKRLRKME